MNSISSQTSGNRSLFYEMTRLQKNQHDQELQMGQIFTCQILYCWSSCSHCLCHHCLGGFRTLTILKTPCCCCLDPLKRTLAPESFQNPGYDSAQAMPFRDSIDQYHDTLPKCLVIGLFARFWAQTWNLECCDSQTLSSAPDAHPLSHWWLKERHF